MDNVYEVQAQLKEMEPKNESLWFHYRGGTYRILLKALEANEPNEVKVIYENIATGHIWELSLSEWQKKVTLEDGRTVDRFSPWVRKEYVNMEELWDC